MLAKYVVRFRSNNLVKSPDTEYGFLANLTNRSLLLLDGLDSTDFLSIYLNANTSLFKKGKRSLYSFIEKNDIIDFDFMVHYPYFSSTAYSGKSYIIDIHQSFKTKFIEYTKANVQKNDNVHLGDLDGLYEVYALHSKGIASKEKEGEVVTELQNNAEKYFIEENGNVPVCDSLCVVDPRIVQLGGRIITPKDSVTITSDLVIDCQGTDLYDILRYSFCIPEGNELAGLGTYNAHAHLYNTINIENFDNISDEKKQRNAKQKQICGFYVGLQKETEIELNHPIDYYAKHRKIENRNKFKGLIGKDILINGKIIGNIINTISNMGIGLIDFSMLTNDELTCEGNKLVVWAPTAKATTTKSAPNQII